MRSAISTGAMFLLAAALGNALPSPADAAPQKKEYLSEVEADKIRDAGTTGPRIALYAAFASDRIKKIQYEFSHMDPADEKRAERLNGLLNG